MNVKSAASPPFVESGVHDRVLEIVLDGNRISHHQREMLERPENYLRPIRLVEYRRRRGAEDERMPDDRRTTTPSDRGHDAARRIRSVEFLAM